MMEQLIGLIVVATTPFLYRLLDRIHCTRQQTAMERTTLSWFIDRLFGHTCTVTLATIVTFVTLGKYNTL
uniref:Uncharacterized protein n=1 Tax=Haemonchus contortus TaxID=6289 RepID=W6NDJ2_HAECO